MPYHVIKVKGGYKVQKKSDKKMMSKNPLTKSKAEAQLKALNMAENKKKLSPAQMDKLKDHSKMHKGGMNSKHMKNMKKFMESGDTFSKAHNKAVKIDKK
jgi:hypothetical protein